MNVKTSLLALLLALATAASAHDFAVDGLYFNLTSATTVALTYEGGYPNGHYSGAIVVPQTIEHQGETYQVTAVTDYAFANCPALLSVELPAGVKSLGMSAFMQSAALTRLLLPEGLEEIGMWAFQGCSSLERLTIPEGVHTLGEGALMQNPRLRYVSLPSTLSTLVQQLFYDDPSLDTLVLHTEEPPAVQNTTVLHNVPATLHVIVPCGTLSAYQQSPWGEWFTNIAEDCGASQGIEPADREAETLTTEYYDLLGRPKVDFHSLPRGVYLERTVTTRGATTRKIVKQ